MIVWRDRETGPVHPSIRSAPSTGTFGIFLSVTTFMMTLPRVEVDNVPEIPGRHKQGSAIFGARRYPTLLSWRRAKSQAEKLDGGNVGRPRAADDFGAIRARMEELRRESARMPAHDHAATTRVGSCWF